MGITLKTHKMLWGRSGNRCAEPSCRRLLAMDVEETDDPSIVGDEAHIVAREPDGPRGESDLNQEQRDKYANLILLCKIHHKLVDDHPVRYPVDVLTTMKANHERWVVDSLAPDRLSQRADEQCAGIVDEMLELLDIPNFRAWTSWLLTTPPRIWRERLEALQAFTEFVLSRLWPEQHAPIRSAAESLKAVASDLSAVFYQHAEEHSDEFITERFYKIRRFDQATYNRLLNDYNFHVALIHDLVMEITRGLNFLFDKVRENLDSSFRRKEGALLIEGGMNQDLRHPIYRPEYRGNERIPHPYPGLTEFMKIRESRDFGFGEGVSQTYLPFSERTPPK